LNWTLWWLFVPVVTVLCLTPGLGALLLRSYRIFFLIKWAGAAYLVCLGINALLSKPDDQASPEIARGTSRSFRRLFVDGLLLQLSNPKAIVFFAALLPQFIDPKGDLVTQVVILGITSVVIESVVLVCYSLAAGRATAVARQPRYARWTNRVSGILLIGAGTGLAGLRRS